MVPTEIVKVVAVVMLAVAGCVVLSLFLSLVSAPLIQASLCNYLLLWHFWIEILSASELPLQLRFLLPL